MSNAEAKAMVKKGFVFRYGKYVTLQKACELIPISRQPVRSCGVCGKQMAESLCRAHIRTCWPMAILDTEPIPRDVPEAYVKALQGLHIQPSVLFTEKPGTTVIDSRGTRPLEMLLTEKPHIIVIDSRGPHPLEKKEKPNEAGDH